MSDADQTNHQPRPDPPAAPVCPRCGGPLREPARFERLTTHGLICIRCGYAWTLRELEEAEDERPDSPQPRACSSCGAPVGRDAQFCQMCGASLFPSSGPKSQRADIRSSDVVLLKQSLAVVDARITRLFDRVAAIESRVAAAGMAPSTLTERPIANLPSVDELVAARIAVQAEPRVPVASAVVPEKAQVVLPVAPSIAPVLRPISTETAPVRSGPSAGRAPLDLERLVSGRGMAFAGGLALLLGALFFLSLAFSRGWIGPNLRVIIGMIAATGMILGGSRFFGRREELIGHVLTATGLGVMSLSMIAATRLYDLVRVELGIAGMLAAALLAAAIAIRADLQVVAAYGIVAALVAPPMLGATANGVTVALIAAALAGTTAIALYRTWTWLPSLAFAISAPQLADWIRDEPKLIGALPALSGFWLLHAIASGGEVFRDRTLRLRPTSATLLVADAALLIWGGFELLDGDAASWRGAFLVAVALAHGGLGSWFLRDRGNRHPFGMLAFGTGVAALTMAAPVQFGGAVVPLAWAAEGVVLAWLSSRLQNPFGGVVAAVMGVLSIAHVITFEYPISELGSGKHAEPAFLNANGMTLGFLFLGFFAGAYVWRVASLRQTLAAIGIMLATYAMSFEASGVRLVVGWAMVAVIAALIRGWRPLLVGDGLERVPGRTLLTISGFAAWALALLHLVTTEYAFFEINAARASNVPFGHAEGIALLFVLGAGGVATARASRATDRLVGILVLFALVLYAMPFELSGAALVGVWSALAVVAIFLPMRVSWLGAELAAELQSVQEIPWRHFMARFGMTPPSIVAATLAILHLITIEYPLGDLVDELHRRPPFVNTNGLALLFGLSAIALLSARATGIHRKRGIAGGFGLVLYAMPFELSGGALIAGWQIAALAALLMDRWPMPVPPTTASLRRTQIAPLHRRGLAVVGAVGWSLGALHWLIIDIRAGRVDLAPAGKPFGDVETLGALILIATAFTGTVIARDTAMRTGAAVAGIATAAVLMPHELGAAATVVAWSGLAVITLLLNERDVHSRRPYLVATVILLGFGLAQTFIEVAPPERLFVDDTQLVDHPLLWSGATAALAALAGAFAFVRGRFARPPRVHIFGIAAAVLTVYLLSVAVVDNFQGQLGEVDLDSLQKRAQVALSILWAVLGGAVFAAGIVKLRRPMRLLGLALLGLATAKVFIYDMASLDASYRVLSLIGLGILLLVCSYLYQRYIGPLDSEDADQDKKPPSAAGFAAGAQG